jgi:putative nucleotidyltransferase with HDIG domain
MSRRHEGALSSERIPAVPAPVAGDSPPGADLLAALERIEGLPALPESVTRMLNLADDPDVSTREVADMVSGDQAMASAVLRLVNAPFFGLGRRISSIQHAVLLVGLRTVRNLVLSVVLVKSFGESSRDRRFDRGRLWRHTVACAAGARLLSKRLGGADPEEAFLAGLVHDMGIVVFDQFFHDGFRRVADLATGTGMPLIDAEREIFGRDHAFVGWQLARRWNFPASVAEAIGCHHDPGRARLDPRLAATVHLSDWLEAATGTSTGAGDSPDVGATPGAESAPVSPIAPSTGTEAWAAADGATGPTMNGQDTGPAPAESAPADPFCASGPLDPATLEVLSLRLQDLEGLRLAVAAERGRTEALVSLLP